jgi:uncharacterized FlgJ-related protein
MKIYKYDHKDLQFKPIFNFNKTIKILGSILILFIIILHFIHPDEENNYDINIESVLLINSPNNFSEDKLINMLSKINLPYPHITLAQAKLETGNFTSKIFNENHNIFGQREAKVRINLAKGTQYNHAYYNNWEESVLDYALWYSTYAYKCKTEDQLYQLLDKIYAEDSSYSRKLKIIVNNENLINKFNKNKI